MDFDIRLRWWYHKVTKKKDVTGNGKHSWSYSLRASRPSLQTGAAILLFRYCVRWRIRDRTQSAQGWIQRLILLSSTSAAPPFRWRLVHRIINNRYKFLIDISRYCVVINRRCPHRLILPPCIWKIYQRICYRYLLFDVLGTRGPVQQLQSGGKMPFQLNIRPPNKPEGLPSTALSC